MKYSSTSSQIGIFKRSFVFLYNLLVWSFLLLSVNSSEAAPKDIIFIDQNRKPISGIVTSVVADKDSTLRFMEVTDDTGRAVLPDSILSNALISASFPGLQPITLRPEECGDSIMLQPIATDLQEVVVTGKDLIRSEGGKIVFTPGELRTRVINAYDLVVNVPLLSGDANSLKLMNNEAHILINGKEPNVPRNQVITELRSLDPRMIKSVEVIPFPGSSYGASGASGVVNIILKDRGNGTWVSIDANGYGGDRIASGTESVNLYFTHNRLRLSAGEQFDYTHSWTRTDQDFLYNTDSLKDQISIHNKARSAWDAFHTSGYVNLSYQLTKRSLLGGGFYILTDKDSQVYSATSVTTRGNDIPQTTESRTVFTQPWRKPQTYYQLFYTFDTDNKGSRLQISGLFRDNSASSSAKYNFAPEMDEHRHQKIEGGSASAKYTQVFNGKQTLLGGYSFRTTRQKDASDSELQTYQFNYNETIHAAYVELKSKWSNVISTNLGLRLENSRISGDLIGGDDLFHRNETGLYPSLGVNIAFPNSTHYLMLNASRSIFRPQFYDLNPYVLWTSSNTCKAGNPNLKASTDWTISAFYMVHQNYILNVSYSLYHNSNNPFSYGENGVSFTTRVNRPKLHNLNFMFEYNKNLTKIWRLRLTTDFRYDNSPFFYNDTDLSEHSLSAVLTFRNRLTFPGKTVTAVDVEGQFGYSTQSFGIGAQWIANLDIRVSKEVLKNFQISAGLDSDVAPLINSKATMSNYQTIKRSTVLPLRGNLSLSYTFGNQRLRYYEDRSDSSYNSRF